MKVDRLVIDSNVWIAALISPAGTARQLMDAGLDHDIDVLMSESMFNELVSRLDRPRFDRNREPESWNSFLTALVELTQWPRAHRVDAHEHHSVHMGPPDHESFQGLMTVTPAAS